MGVFSQVRGALSTGGTGPLGHDGPSCESCQTDKRAHGRPLCSFMRHQDFQYRSDFLVALQRD